MAISPASEDDRSLRSGHPLAKRLWSLLRDRSESDRRLVHEALLSRIEDPTRTANQEIALEALRRFAADAILPGASEFWIALERIQALALPTGAEKVRDEHVLVAIIDVRL